MVWAQEQGIEHEIRIHPRTRTVMIYRRYQDGRLRFLAYAQSVQSALEASKGVPTTIIQ
jgi:hypothetical protein